MHTVIRTAAIAAVLACTTLGAHAQNVTVKDAWVRATVPQQKATGAFMQLQASVDSKFVSVSSPLTPVVEIHEMAMQGDVMRMRQVPSIPLPAGQTVALKPGGHHLMLMNLPAQVREGDTVPFTLVFENKDGKRETVDIKAPVRALNNAARPAHAHH